MKHISLLTCIALAALTLGLSACGGGKSTPPTGTASAPTDSAPMALKEQIDKLEGSGQVPKLDRSSSVPGPDINSNGVRDDIDAYIASLPFNNAQKKAAIQEAKALQMTLTVDLTDKVALQKVGDALMASTKCSGDILGRPSTFSDKIEGFTANTKERTKRYMQYNAARSGSTTSMPSKDYCEL